MRIDVLIARAHRRDHRIAIATTLARAIRTIAPLHELKMSGLCVLSGYLAGYSDHTERWAATCPSSTCSDFLTYPSTCRVIAGDVGGLISAYRLSRFGLTIVFVHNLLVGLW